MEREEGDWTGLTKVAKPVKAAEATKATKYEQCTLPGTLPGTSAQEACKPGGRDKLSVTDRIHQLVAHYRDIYAAERAVVELSKVAPRVDGHLRAMIADEQKYTCALCRSLFSGGFHIDHRRPQYQGGDSSRGNLWALCTNCHGRKTALENSARIQAERESMAVVQALEQHARAVRTQAPLYPRGTSMCTSCGDLHCSRIPHACRMAHAGSLRITPIAPSHIRLHAPLHASPHAASRGLAAGSAGHSQAGRLQGVGVIFGSKSASELNDNHRVLGCGADVASSADWDTPLMF